MTAPLILWFRQDLRLHDNPALHAAIQTGAPIIPVYILDDITPGAWKMGAASCVWLHHSLAALNTSLNNKMVFMRGAAGECLHTLITATGARGVYWNRCYEPYAIARDTKIKDDLTRNNHDARSFNASLLFEPWEVTKSDGTPYKVFTPFWTRGCMGRADTIAQAQSTAKSFALWQGDVAGALSLDNLNLLPTRPRWDIPMMRHWTPGEDGAQKRFTAFLDHALHGYKDGRNIPSQPNTSRLSPHLHFGEISPRQIYHTVRFAIDADPTLANDGNNFLSEIGWREFSNHLLYHCPTLPEQPLQPRFEKFPWDDNAEHLDRWKTGQTGYPIVDAGMRELWATGYMHNRVRMIVGSFLVKHLLTHWRHGEDWFWDTLFDADLANNAASWQWIAGCGADAAPYFRVFNPTLQAEKFDQGGTYIKTWVPECGTVAYPKPIVSHAAARDRALAAFARTKS